MTPVQRREESCHRAAKVPLAGQGLQLGAGIAGDGPQFRPCLLKSRQLKVAHDINDVGRDGEIVLGRTEP